MMGTIRGIFFLCSAGISLVNAAKIHGGHEVIKLIKETFAKKYMKSRNIYYKQKAYLIFWKGDYWKFLVTAGLMPEL